MCSQRNEQQKQSQVYVLTNNVNLQDASRSDNIQSPMRSKYTDDKNCQFMQPVKPKSVVWLAKPAGYEYTRKMQSNPRKRIQKQFNQMNDSNIEKVQSQCVPKKCKKIQPVMQPVKKLSPDVTSTTKV